MHLSSFLRGIDGKIESRDWVFRGARYLARVDLEYVLNTARRLHEINAGWNNKYPILSSFAIGNVN